VGIFNGDRCLPAGLYPIFYSSHKKRKIKVIYSFENIAEVISGRILQIKQNDAIHHLLLDSRKLYSPSNSLFFALKSPRRDAHEFIGELYSKGVRNFVISERHWAVNFESANFILVADTLGALQQLATHHRRQFNMPVIGITGSNGKTIVKEWLYQLLQDKFNIVRSPKSYNSQIGVPLSVWQMNEQHNLGIFEAGISQPGEMDHLQRIIQPTIGILTNIGEAHSEGFPSMADKAQEKTKLFASCNGIVYSPDNSSGENFELKGTYKEIFKNGDAKFYEWSKAPGAWLSIRAIEKENGLANILAKYAGNDISIGIPFTDDASIENAISCWAVMLALEIGQDHIQQRMLQLQPVNMRLELKKGINQCSIINDSYSADLSSLGIALNFLSQQTYNSKKTVILSDFFQTGLPADKLYNEIEGLLSSHDVDRCIGIGEQISRYMHQAAISSGSKMRLQFFNTVDDFIKQFRSSQFKEETILVKGARVFEFERIVHLLEQKIHQTVLEINLNSIAHNVKEYQELLKPSTKIMAMVKAFAYGSGGAEIASILQFHKIDWLGVAYADEGVELRRSGITTPIMIMNPESITFDAIVDNNLEPDIYSFELLRQLDLYLRESGLQEYPVHLEIETGMNRLGFSEDEVDELAAILKKTSSFKIQTVFSHLAASEDPKQDEFTNEQYQKFIRIADKLGKIIGYSFLKHIANSAAITRHPKLQMDMVRLGIGMYGVDSTDSRQLNLETVAELRSTIAQIKHLKKGESVSYNRKGVVQRDAVIATIRIGYADGYPRRLGNGVGKMLVNGKLYPVIGVVCMDMTMLDITGAGDIKEGDDVIIFGKGLHVQQLADWAETIPYEIMTGISQRVKRVYYEE
jgi:alanine racemase